MAYMRGLASVISREYIGIFAYRRWQDSNGTVVVRELTERGEAGRVLWVAPSSELVEQAADCINDLWRRFPGGPIADVFR